MLIYLTFTLLNARMQTVHEDTASHKRRTRARVHEADVAEEEEDGG